MSSVLERIRKLRASGTTRPAIIRILDIIEPIAKRYDRLVQFVYTGRQMFFNEWQPLRSDARELSELAPRHRVALASVDPWSAEPIAVEELFSLPITQALSDTITRLELRMEDTKGEEEQKRRPILGTAALRNMEQFERAVKFQAQEQGGETRPAQAVRPRPPTPYYARKKKKPARKARARILQEDESDEEEEEEEQKQEWRPFRHTVLKIRSSPLVFESLEEPGNYQWAIFQTEDNRVYDSSGPAFPDEESARAAANEFQKGQNVDVTRAHLIRAWHAQNSDLGADDLPLIETIELQGGIGESARRYGFVVGNTSTLDRQRLISLGLELRTPLVHYSADGSLTLAVFRIIEPTMTTDDWRVKVSKGI